MNADDDVPEEIRKGLSELPPLVAVSAPDLSKFNVASPEGKKPVRLGRSYLDHLAGVADELTYMRAEAAIREKFNLQK